MPQLRPHRKNTSKPAFRGSRPMTFCRCSECIVYPYIDAQAREVMTGRLITLDQFKEHQKREVNKQAALQRLEVTLPLPENKGAHTSGTHQPLPTANTTQANDTTGTHQSLPTTKNDSSSAGVQRKAKKHKIRDSSTFYVLLCSFRTRLQVCPAATFFKEQCILFSNPPKKMSSKVQGYLDLDVGAPQNQAILIHERWLWDGVCRIQFQLNSRKYPTSSHERLLAAIVIRNIKMELDQLEIFKTEEWERQFKLVKERSAPVIDTCKG